MRIPSFSRSVIDWDESLYALIGRELLAGNLPYVAAFEIKPFGTFAAMAGSMAAFGKNVFAIRMLGLIAVCASCLLLHRAALMIGLSRLPALAGGVLYVLVTSYLGGLATNIEILFAPFSIAVFLLFIRQPVADSATSHVSWALRIGFLMGIAIWFKYVAALGVCALGTIAFLRWLGTGMYLWRAAWLGVVCLGAAVLPTALTAAYYASAGHWAEFWGGNFGFMAAYARTTDETGDPLTLGRIFWVSLPIIPILGPALLGIASLRFAPLLIASLVLWLLVEIVAVAAPGKFYDHYFIMIVPPLCVLAAIGLQCMAIAPIGGIRSPVAILAVLVPVCFPYLVKAHARAEFQTPDAASSVANAISTDVRNGASVWVVNSQPIIYLLTGAKLPTAFLMPPHLLTGFSDIIPTNADSEIQRIMDSRPTYLITETGRWKGTLEHRKQSISHFILTRYQLVAEFQNGAGMVQLYRERGWQRT